MSFDEDGHPERGETPTVMNPNDEFALRAALQIRVQHGGHVSVMRHGAAGVRGPARAGDGLGYADDRDLLSDREVAAADAQATAMTPATRFEALEEGREVRGVAVTTCSVRAADVGGGCYRAETVERNGHGERVDSLDTQPCVE